MKTPYLPVVREMYLVVLCFPSELEETPRTWKVSSLMQRCLAKIKTPKFKEY